MSGASNNQKGRRCKRPYVVLMIAEPAGMCGSAVPVRRSYTLCRRASIRWPVTVSGLRTSGHRTS